jgi:fructose-1,6-bisphosphatase II / sedoheptulose-1,7-bisphosphatase
MGATSILTPQLAFALAGVTERAAIAAERLVGRGDEMAADQAAVDAMRSALNEIEMKGRIVIGEGERDEAPMLYIGEEVGTLSGPAIDIALDPLEGTTLAAKAMPNALSVAAISSRGGLLNAPDVYMEKLAIGPGFPKDVVDLDAPAGENALRLAKAKGLDPREITVCVLDRPRHQKIIDDLRRVGARINLISDGDIAGVINTTDIDTHVDMYVGQGGAPEGVLAAAALKCAGGQIQARLVFRTDKERARAERLGMRDLNRRYTLEELAPGETIFCATGITKGGLVDGVRRVGGSVHTHTLVMSSFDGICRKIRSVTPLSMKR